MTRGWGGGGVTRARGSRPAAAARLAALCKAEEWQAGAGSHLTLATLVLCKHKRLSERSGHRPVAAVTSDRAHAIPSRYSNDICRL